MPGYPVDVSTQVNSASVNPAAELTEIPFNFPSTKAAPDPRMKPSGRFCPPRTTNASSGRLIEDMSDVGDSEVA